MEFLRDHSGLPMGEESCVKCTPDSKHGMYAMFEAALFRDTADPLCFSYPGNHPLTGEFEEQMTILLREYKGDRELLLPHAPEEPGAHDDAPTVAASGCMGSAKGMVGVILFA